MLRVNKIDYKKREINAGPLLVLLKLVVLLPAGSVPQKGKDMDKEDMGGGGG